MYDANNTELREGDRLYSMDAPKVLNIRCTQIFKFDGIADFEWIRPRNEPEFRLTAKSLRGSNWRISRS